ncbi:MAG: hypothetical protein IJA81_08975 [Akkermansia sp.]|nr:hypothetical protein [Akkermansia sp.]
MSKEDWKDYLVTVGGIEFRPVSMGTLTLLYNIQSPLVVGGEVEPLDFCVFAWMHAAPIMEVFAAVKSGTYIKKSVLWGAEVPPVVFASYIPDTIAALADDLSKVFIEESSGYIPFPVPSLHRQSWLVRVWNFITRLFQRG